jgi:hypothetical protein
MGSYVKIYTVSFSHAEQQFQLAGCDNYALLNSDEDLEYGACHFKYINENEHLLLGEKNAVDRS